MSDSKGAAIRAKIADLVKTVSDNLGADRMGETMANDVADEILALLAQEVKEAQDNIVAFMEYLNEGTLEERKAKVEAAKEWNKNRPDKERLG